MKIVIIGSGIAGLSTAIALRKAGLDVLVYERAKELTEVGAGISLWSNALQALDLIGAGDSVQPHLLSLRCSEFRGRNGHVIAVSFPAATLEKSLGYAPIIGMIHRAELVSSLASCLPDNIIRFGCELSAIRGHTGDYVDLEFSNGLHERADLVIGADGIHSTLRRCLGDDSLPRYAGYTCFRGITKLPDSLEPGYLAEWWGRGQRFGITTLTRRRVYWWATVNVQGNLQIDNKRDWLYRRFSNWAVPVPELIETTPVSALLQNDIIDRKPERNWQRGRCLLVGDAAHPTTPNLGQGGCMAIEDAAILFQLFSQSLPWSEVYAKFVNMRFDRTKAINVDSRRLGSIGQWQGKISCWLRDSIASFGLPKMGPNALVKHAKCRELNWDSEAESE